MNCIWLYSIYADSDKVTLLELKNSKLKEILGGENIDMVFKENMIREAL